MNPTTPVEAETLRSLAFLTAMPDEELQALVPAARWERYAAGAVLFREGDHLAHFYVVAEGTVAIEILAPDRRPRRIQTIGPGELLGWSAILGTGAMTATARALTPVQAVAFDSVAVRAACDADPWLGYRLLGRVAVAVAGRLNATRLQLLDVYRHDLPDAPEGGSP